MIVCAVQGEPVYKRYGFDIVGRVDCKDRAGITLSGPTMERPPRPLSPSFVLPPPLTGESSTVGKDKAQDGKPEVKLDFVDSEMDWPPLVEARLAAFEGTPINERLHPIERRPPLGSRIGSSIPPLSPFLLLAIKCLSSRLIRTSTDSFLTGRTFITILSRRGPKTHPGGALP